MQTKPFLAFLAAWLSKFGKRFLLLWMMTHALGLPSPQIASKITIFRRIIQYCKRQWTKKSHFWPSASNLWFTKWRESLKLSASLSFALSGNCILDNFREQQTLRLFCCLARIEWETRTAVPRTRSHLNQMTAQPQVAATVPSSLTAGARSSTFTISG